MALVKTYRHRELRVGFSLVLTVSGLSPRPLGGSELAVRGHRANGPTQCAPAIKPDPKTGKL